MKSVVTGANGYLASNLVRHLLARGDSVVAIVNEKTDRIPDRSTTNDITVLRSDCMEDAVRDAKEVYHMAGFFSTKSDPQTVRSLVASNLLLTVDLYAAVENFAPDAHVIAASSFSQLDSEGRIAPDSYYAGMKALVELGTPALEDRLTFLRVSDTYGPNDPRTKVHNLCARTVAKGETFQFQSPANTQIALTHVDDVADAFMYLENSRVPGAFNLLNSELKITLGEIGDILQKSASGEVRFPHDTAAPSQIPFGVDLIPGWHPKYKAEDNLPRILAEGHGR